MVAPADGSQLGNGTTPPALGLKPYYTPQEVEQMAQQGASWIDKLWTKFWAAMMPGLRVVGYLAVSIIDDVLAGITQMITQTQGKDTPGFFTLMAAVLEDLLGVEVSAADFSSAFKRGGSIAGVRAIGGRLLNQLETEFSPGPQLTPAGGMNAARAFLGFLMAFSIRQGNVEFIAELLPEELRIGEGIRAYGELLAKNLGLGRLARRVLQPLIQVMVSDPMTWYLNQKFHPHLLGASQAIRAHNRGLMDDATLQLELDYDGYNPQRAAALTAETLEQTGNSELYTLYRYGAIDGGQFAQLMQRRGVETTAAQRYLNAQQFSDADPAVTAYLDLVRSQRVAGYIDGSTFAGQVDSLPISPEYKARWKNVVGYQMENPRAHLTLSELQAAYVAGIIDLEDLTAGLSRLGYSDDDSQTLQYLTLLKLDTLVAKQAVARFSWEKAKAKAAAKNEPEPPMPAILAT